MVVVAFIFNGSTTSGAATVLLVALQVLQQHYEFLPSPIQLSNPKTQLDFSQPPESLFNFSLLSSSPLYSISQFNGEWS